MTNFFRAGAVGISLGVAACAIHPLPEDVTGVPTHRIVQRIRCEARQAVKETLVQYLAQSPDPAMRQLGVEIDTGVRPLYTLSDRLFRGEERKVIRKFENAAIAYNFTFDMTEMNNFDPTIDLIKPWTNAIGTAAIGGNFDRTRENIRTFTITDTFLHLFTLVKPGYCSEFSSDKNYVYPITGKIGLGEMIHTFVQLALFDNLSTDPTKTGPPTMGDTFTFTTTISGSVTPKIVLTPIGTSLQLADASFIASASRRDMHTVIVGLAVEPPPAQTPSLGTHAKVGFLINARGTPAEITAAHTVEQLITRFELGKPNGTVILANP